MMLEIDIESDEEWDSSTDWSLLVRRAAESALAESAFPQLVDGPRPVELSVRPRMKAIGAISISPLVMRRSTCSAGSMS